ncbi:IS21 family transposase [Thiocapsa imhoffii]|uniref:IS21 family transposase n=2 Tax=Thiocapsa imhoffii TaxID=382777 RepID=A0A9X0WLQ7_9GAMM|nr:IS21 family transposase [Thiocapsa imhoffii]
MPRQRLSMRKVDDVLRLKWGSGRSVREIARALGIGRTTVLEYLDRAEAAGLSWPLPEGLSADELERRLFKPGGRPAELGLVEPDFDVVHRERRRKGVTLFLLWQEYRERHPEGYSYSQFCARYSVWKGRVDVVMRQTHRAGEKLFVDYAGQTAAVIDPDSGEIRTAQIFVAVLGASNDTYAEATWTQALPDWIGAQVRALNVLGGCPDIIVPDNLKSAVSKAHRYEPDLNPTDQDFAAHYGLAVIPARVRKPRDQAKAEGGVLLVERWILARLRHQEFFSLTELNGVIATHLQALNTRPFKKLDCSRLSQFEAIDRPALRALPATPYEYAEWRKARVAPNIHIEVDGHFYSVPHALVKRQVDVRLTTATVEILHHAQRVASHVRSPRRGGYTTVTEHMPERHQRALEWTPERLQRWAHTVGPATGAVTTQLLGARRHPQQAFNACFGVLRLSTAYSEARLEAACARALTLGTVSYKSLATILEKGLDQRPLPTPDQHSLPLDHANLRGADYDH